MQFLILWYCVVRGAFYLLGLLAVPLHGDVKWNGLDWLTRLLAIAIGVCAFLAVLDHSICAKQG